MYKYSEFIKVKHIWKNKGQLKSKWVWLTKPIFNIYDQ